jgi:tetratricopeptide (TPR) repeat protein
MLDESLDELHKAVAINPSNTVARYRIGETLLFSGKYAQALDAFRNVPREANPSLIGHQTAWALIHLGKNAEATATLDQFLKDYPDDNGGLYTSVQAVLAALAGNKAEAEAKVKIAVEKGKGFGHFHHSAFHIACAYAVMNRPDKAVDWLRKVVDGGFPSYPLFADEPLLNNLRNDQQFTDLMSELKRSWDGYRSSTANSN